MRLYIGLSLIGLFLSIYILITRGFTTDGNVFYNLRYSYTYLKLPTYGSEYLSLFSLLCSVIFLLEKNNKKSFLFLSFSIIASLSFAERTSILYSMAFYYYFYSSIYKQTLYKKIFFVIFVLIIFQIIASSAGKGYSNNGSNYLYSYFAYPLESYSEKIMGHNVMASYRSVFGVLAIPIDIIQDEPIINNYDEGGFNVYSYLFPALNLLGEGLFYMMMVIFAVLLSIINYISRKFFYFHFISASLYFSCVMIFYAWTFSVTTHLYVALIALPLFYRLEPT